MPWHELQLVQVKDVVAAYGDVHCAERGYGNAFPCAGAYFMIHDVPVFVVMPRSHAYVYCPECEIRRVFCAASKING